MFRLPATNRPHLCYSIKIMAMKATLKRSEKKGSTYLVKLKIDARTTILVRTPESLKNWKAKYPNAIELAN